MIPQREVSFRGTASGQDRGVAGFEKRLHLGFLIWSRIDVPVRIDEPGHGRHAPGTDGLATRRRRYAGGHGSYFPATHHDRSAIDDRSVTDNDTGADVNRDSDVSSFSGSSL